MTGAGVWAPIQRLITTYDSFLITAHINPDGDAIGSEMALKAYLESLDKAVTVVNVSETPDSLRFLDPAGDIRVYSDKDGRAVLDDIDCIFILDLNTWEQLGFMARVIQHNPLPRICIDHHQNPAADFAPVIVSDTAASATGVLMYELICAMKGTVTREIADALYCAIITDTGTFRFSNADARTFRAATALVEAGADPHELHRQVFASKNWSAGKLLGPVFSTLQSDADGRLAWIHATQKMVNDAGGSYDDMDGFVDLVRAIKGVELVLFFKETQDGHVKVSLRSNGNVDAYAIASHFGGGGHKMASGVRLDGPMDKAVDTMVSVCRNMAGVR